MKVSLTELDESARSPSSDSLFQSFISAEFIGCGARACVCLRVRPTALTRFKDAASDEWS